LAIESKNSNDLGYNLATNKINSGYYEKLFQHFEFGDDHLPREAISANNYDLHIIRIITDFLTTTY
jgi:hypothetical protein